MRKIVFGVALFGMTALPVWAEESEIPRNQWEIGPEIYYFHYREPNVGVEFKGPMYGIQGSFTHHNSNHLMLRAEGRSALGLVYYSGSGTIDNILDWTLEGRATAGYDVVMSNGQLLTPFFGVGYRYLNDDTSGKISSTGAAGYDRESNYLYSPVGLEVTTPMSSGWRIGASVEDDIFWTGQQKSHLEDVAAGLNTISNDQNQGYGVRGSVKFQKSGERLDWVIEPYVRWWSIRDSTRAKITYGGAIIGYAYEPKNETLEIGGNISVRF